MGQLVDRVARALELAVGVGITLLGVAQMGAQLLVDLLLKFSTCFLRPVRLESSLLAFSSICSPRKPRKMIRRCANRVLGETGTTPFPRQYSSRAAPLGVDRACSQFVVHALGGDEHQRDIERAFAGQNVLLGNGVGMQAHGL